MKIVHVMLWYIPGMGYQENHLPAEQKKMGHDVEIITSDRFPDYRGFKQHIGRIHVNRIVGTGIFNENDVKIHRLPCFLEVKNGGELLLKGLKKKLKELKPDVVQAHGAFCPLTLQAIFYSKGLNYTVFVDDHCHENNFSLDSVPKKVYISAVKLFYSIFMSRVVCFMPVTYSSKQILQTVLNIPDEQITLQHLGVDINRFKQSLKLRKSLRTELKLTDDEILIISSGKFDECKDIHVLIKAFGEISNNSYNLKLLLVGNGPDVYMQKLKRIVKTRGLKPKVLFHDFVSNKELPKYYNGADIGVWPGDHSITVIEAVATGLPVIVFSSCLAYDILFKNKAAVGFERGNVGDLSKCICALIQDKKTRNEMMTHASNFTKQELSWKRIAKNSIEIYKNTIDEHTPSHRCLHLN